MILTRVITSNLATISLACLSGTTYIFIVIVIKGARVIVILMGITIVICTTILISTLTLKIIVVQVVIILVC